MVGAGAIGAIAAVGVFVLYSQTRPHPKMANPVSETPKPSIAENVSIEQVKTTNEANLLKMEGVEKVEVGEKDKKPCIVVFSFKETDDLKKLENNGLDGYEVKIENSAQN